MDEPLPDPSPIQRVAKGLRDKLTPAIERPWIIVLTSLVISVGWVVLLGSLDSGVSAGRGGAIAVALSLFALFIVDTSEDHVLTSLKKVIERQRDLFPHVDLSSMSLDDLLRETNERLRAIEYEMDDLLDTVWASVRLRQEAALRANVTLGMASLVGTVFWGFGDLMAPYIALHWT